MKNIEIKKNITIPERSFCTKKEYCDFLIKSYRLMKSCSNYFASNEDVNSLELAHLTEFRHHERYKIEKTLFLQH